MKTCFGTIYLSLYQHYLRPGERSGHDIAIQLDINAGVPIEASDCSSHVVQREVVSPERLVVRLGANDRIPNKDFVFRFRVAGGRSSRVS